MHYGWNIVIWDITNFFRTLNDIVEQSWQNRWIKILNIEYNKRTVLLYFMFLNNYITADEFFHWLTWIEDVGFLLILSYMILTILPIFVLVGFLSLKVGLVWYFKHKKYEKCAELSKYIWALKCQGITSIVK